VLTGKRAGVLPCHVSKSFGWHVGFAANAMRRMAAQAPEQPSILKKILFLFS
jgi:hypothetical protein